MCMWETTCRTETVGPLSSCSRASARSLNCSANYQLRALALLQGLGTPHSAPDPAWQFKTWSEWRARVLTCVPVACVCLLTLYLYMRFVHQYLRCVFSVCMWLWVVPCGSSRCWGLVKHFLRQLHYLTCLLRIPPWFLWNETIWETSRHLI